ncbi:hypothetical protein [Streptomyces sp. GSL17-111]
MTGSYCGTPGVGTCGCQPFGPRTVVFLVVRGPVGEGLPVPGE